MELCLVCNSSVAHLELNSEGLGVYSDEHVVFCHDCGEAYHTFCLDPPVVDKSFLKPSPLEWRCAHCKFCVLCQQPHNESQLVVCDHCDRCFHSYCAKLSDDEINGESWLCAECRKCSHCHSSFSTVSPTTPALRRYSLCNDCDKLYEARIEPLAELIKSMIRAESAGESLDSTASMPPTKRVTPPTASQSKQKSSESSTSHTAPSPTRPAELTNGSEIRHSHMPPALPLDMIRHDSLHVAPSITSMWENPSQPTRFATQPQLSHFGIPTSTPHMSSAHPSHAYDHLHPHQATHPSHNAFADPRSRELQFQPNVAPSAMSHHGYHDHQAPGFVHPAQLSQAQYHRQESPAPSLPRLDHRSGFPTQGPQGPHQVPTGASLPRQHMQDSRIPQQEMMDPTGAYNRSPQLHSYQGPQFSPFGYSHAGTTPHNLPQARAQLASPPPPPPPPNNPHGTTIELYTPNQHPFAIPADAIAVVIGEHGSHAFPQPPTPTWRQIFELSPSSYQQLCDFFRGLESVYSRFPAFLIPGGQFPVVSDCPPSEHLMNVLLSGATPQTRPPYLLPREQPLPSGTLLLPPREFLFPAKASPILPPQPQQPMQVSGIMAGHALPFRSMQPPNGVPNFPPSMPLARPNPAQSPEMNPALPSPRIHPGLVDVKPLIPTASMPTMVTPPEQRTPSSLPTKPLPPSTTTPPPQREVKKAKSESSISSNDSESVKREKRKRSTSKAGSQKQLGGKLNHLLVGPPLLFILEAQSWDPTPATVELVPAAVSFRYVGCATPSVPPIVNRPNFTSSMLKSYAIKDPYYIDRRVCSLCRCQGDHAILGRLLPLQLVDEWIHSSCAVWAAEVFPSDGELNMLYQALRKANKTHCHTCKVVGASVACAIPGCGRRFHLPCLLNSASRMVSEHLVRYAICPEHSARHGKVRWTSERRDANSAVPVELHADDGPAGRFSMASFDTFCKLHLSESDLRTKVAKHEGEVALEEWVNYIFRCGALTVTKLGCISTRGPFHTPAHIFPSGYRALRRYWSWKDDLSGAIPETLLPPLGNTKVSSLRTDANRPFSTHPLRSTYEIQICEDDPKLKFMLTCLDDPTDVLVAGDLGLMWSEVVYRVNLLRSATTSPDTDFDASSDSSATLGSRRSRPPARPNTSLIANHLPSTFFLGLDLTHISSHIERLPGAKELANYKRHHDMVIRLPSVQAVAVARYFDPDTYPDILNVPPTESGAARCQPYVPLPPMARFRQLDAFPDHPAAALVQFKELARTRARYNQPLYQLPQEAHIRGSINSHNVGSYSKLTRFKLMKASEKVRLKVLRSKIQGRGLFVMEDAMEGEFLIEYVGEMITHRVADEREKRYQARGIGCYMFSLSKEFVIDATMQGNHSRFINHSCEPNCDTQIEVIDGTPRIVITAKHALRQGEELTYDYHFEPELEKLKCYCGAPSCRGFMN